MASLRRRTLLVVAALMLAPVAIFTLAVVLISTAQAGRQLLESLLPQDLALSGAPRGPPQA